MSLIRAIHLNKGKAAPSYVKLRSVRNIRPKIFTKNFYGGRTNMDASDRSFIFVDNFPVIGISSGIIAAASLYYLLSEDIDSGKVALAAEKTTMQGLIPKFAKVQDALKSVGYKEADNFPQIVVVGVQSSGKSSVLENIVGEEFLPKGEGTVTKRPIILTLHNTSDTGEKYAELPEHGKHRFTNFQQLERKIGELNSKFTDVPLKVDIYSPNVVDLRLVDLPGLIHNPTVKQPQDMRERIKEMCKSYVESPNTVMLAISPANSDLQTSEALRFCRKFDEHGERTISVLTKLDLVDRNEIKNLVDTMNQLPLRLGYVGVKCRSKSDLVEGLDIQDALDNERLFFSSNPLFKRAGIKTGTTELANELSNMLERQVAKSLPTIIEKVRIDLLTSRKELISIGGPLPKTTKEKNELLLNDLSNFLKNFLGPSTMDNIKSDIAQHIYLTIHEECQKSLVHFSRSYNEQAQRLRKLPPNAPVFWEGNEDIRFLRWKENVELLADHLSVLSERLTFRVVELLRDRIDPSLDVLKQRPALKESVRQLTVRFLNKGYEETVEHIKYLVLLEKNISYNSKHLDERFNQFARDDQKLPVQEPKKSGFFGFGGSQQDSNPFKTESLKYGKEWTETYLDYLAERLSMNIYNALCVEILDQLKENLKNGFIVELVEHPQKDDLLKENPAVELKRQQLETQITELDRSLQVLSQIASGLK